MRIARIGAWTSLIGGLVALLFVLLGAGALAMMGGFFGIFGVDTGTWKSLNAYPLGAVGAVTVYLLGIALGLLGFRQARWAGFGMLLIGIVAISLGGPIAEIYGVVLLIATLLCLLGGARSASRSMS